MKVRLRLAFSVSLTFASLFGAPVEAPRKPKLVLAIVIDQFRYDYLLRFRADYNSGLARLLDQGAVFTDAHYRHATTVTAVGHSTVMSGAPPSISGIIANEWYDRASARTITSVFDPSTKLVGGLSDAPGASPRRLLVSTIGDELKTRDPNSKVISLSLKDRGAILPGGHRANGAYWYDTDTSAWVTSTYYREQLPDWVKAVNDEHPGRRYLGARWMPFDASGDSAAPLCTMVAGTEVRFCGSLEATPWGNEMIEALAERALEGESLGSRGNTDLLAVSFSSNDYVGHAVGPDDPAVRDISIRTDRLIGKLLDSIDRRLGDGNTLVVLTADHGVAPMPEVNQRNKMPGGRLSGAVIVRNINAALEKRFGEGPWLLPGWPTMLYLNLELIRTRQADRSEVERVAADAARASDHIARVYTRSQLLSGEVPQDDIGRAEILGFYGPRSGDVFILPEPYYSFEASGTSHGTPYAYDTHVPLIFFGTGIRHVTSTRRVAVNDIAPTLAALLGIAEPSGSIGTVLSEVSAP